MRICPKCGRANDVTRKYCTRCGASLLKVAEEQTSKPSVSIPEVGRVVTGASLKKIEAPEEPLFSDAPSESDEARTVHPSEVSLERVRTADRHVEKTEYERAQEVFAASEGLGSDERSVRASELQGLDVETMEESPPENALDVSDDSATPMDYKEGKEVVQQILEKVRAAEARAKEEEASRSESKLTVEEEQVTPETAESMTYAEPVSADERSLDVLFSPAQKTTSTESYVKDDKIRAIESDMKAINIEHQQLQSEYDKLRTRLDEELERYRVVADTKRIRVEGIERELQSAKTEYEQANKEHKNVDNRRKKELSDAEKRISDGDKRLRKAEDAKEKRIRDLEKERLKREEEAKKDRL